jgi:transposase
MAMTIVETTRPVTGGVDTHLDVHVAAAVDASGGVLGVQPFATTTAGFVELHAWLETFGSLERVGVEGTGAYGAGLARYLREPGSRGDRGRSPEPSAAPAGG